MAANHKTLDYLQAGVINLLEHGSFRNGLPFRPTQQDALHAYRDYLAREDLSASEKLSGFFILPTGTGKTALFLAIVDEAHAVARDANDELRTMIVVPTRQLLQQTHKAVKQWAPDYTGNVGRYGDGHKQLDKELSLVIYNSWVTLMEEGKIDSSKIDILISDEAHRGTSERRITNQFNAFANGTAQIAFTATAHFDEEKSVEQSHGKLIFERSLPDAVRLDELAAYIQTQLHIIRVAPMDARDEFTEAAESTGAVRAGMRQEAWMRNMVNILREGRDELTGDLLSDNKSGFYVADTAMADRTADLLCEDLELQQRAREKGCVDVAVSIHSNMSPKTQDDLLKAFVRGDYMVCVSDSKLKEGFDDPTLKNVFDYPRGSLVDKAQIIGRAARKWFNEEKGRFEGATIIDTIVYIGSEDAVEDTRLKENAIRNAIMAWSVLDGTVVLSPVEEKRIGEGRKLADHEGIGRPVLGEDVESFITLEEVQGIYAKQQELLEDDKIPLTDEMRVELVAHIERTGIGSKAFMTIYQDMSDEISSPMLNGWIHRNYGIVNVPKGSWERVIAAYEALPDSNNISLAGARTILIMHMERTGIMSRSFLKLHPEIASEVGLSKLESWRDPNSSTKNVDKSLFEKVILAYKSLPDSKDIPLTSEMRLELMAHMERTGIKGQAFI